MNRYLASALASAALIALLSPTQPPTKTAQSSIEQRGQGVLDAMKDAADALGKVKDDATAEAAKKKLRAAESLVKEKPWMKDVMTGEETKWVLLKFEPKLRQAEFDLVKAQDILFTTNPKLFDTVADAESYKKLKTANIDLVQRTAHNLQSACKAYYLSDEKWPAKITDLVGGDGGRSFVEGGEKGITDPWGKQYKLTMEKDATGEEYPVVSTVTPYGEGKLEIRWPKKDK